MKSLQLLSVAGALVCVSPVFAGTITFETAPATYWEPNTHLYGNNGQGQDLGGFYSGVVFGPGAQLTSTSTVFPAHSPNLELTDADPTGVGNYSITMTFTTAQTEVSFWYDTFFGFTITGVEGNGNTVSLGSKSSTVNPVTSLGTTAFVDLTDAGGLKSITISDAFGLEAGDITIDDLTAAGLSGNPVPDAANTLALLAFAGVGFAAFRRKLAA